MGDCFKFLWSSQNVQTLLISFEVSFIWLRSLFGKVYFVFVSFRSLKTREKYTNWNHLVCNSFVSVYMIFKHRAIYVYFYKRKYFVKVNIDGYVLKQYTNWDKLRQTKLSQFVYFSFLLRECEETKIKFSAPLYCLKKLKIKNNRLKQTSIQKVM